MKDFPVMKFGGQWMLVEPDGKIFYFANEVTARVAAVFAQTLFDALKKGKRPL